MKNILLFIAVVLLTVFYILEMDLKAITTLNWVALGVAAVNLIALLIAIVIQTNRGKKAQQKLAETDSAAAAVQEPAKK